MKKIGILFGQEHSFPPAFVERVNQKTGGKDIVAYGGASFAQSLIELDVIDDYRFLIHPVILGSGLPVFTKAKELMTLELVEERRFPKGAVAHVYNRKRG